MSPWATAPGKLLKRLAIVIDLSSLAKSRLFDNFNLGQEFQGKKQVKSAIGGKVIGITTYRLGKIKKEG